MARQLSDKLVTGQFVLHSVGRLHNDRCLAGGGTSAVTGLDGEPLVVKSFAAKRLIHP
jgi:hypothetical protein